MQISISEERGATVLRPVGRLDTTHGHVLEEAIRARLEGGAAALVIDMSGVEYVSSHGLSVLLTGAKIAKQAGSTVLIAALHPAVAQMFELSGFGRFLGVFEDCDAAIRSLSDE